MIADRLKKVLLRELALDAFDFRDATMASEVPGWDSLSHARILSAVENEFGLRFKTVEVMRLSSVGDLNALVESKLSR